MSLFPLGILSAAGAGGVAGETYELIETQILGSAQSSVTFSSLATYASTYKHLQIRAAGKGSGNSFEETNVNLRFNGDSGSNYSYHFLNGLGSSATSGAGTSATLMNVGKFADSGVATAIFGAIVIDILDSYSTTKYKTVRSLYGKYSSASYPRLGLYSGNWMNTNSLTSIEVLPDGNFVTGSRFSLYGIRG
jgi:hypothetical protein